MLLTLRVCRIHPREGFIMHLKTFTMFLKSCETLRMFFPRPLVEVLFFNLVFFPPLSSFSSSPPLPSHGLGYLARILGSLVLVHFLNVLPWPGLLGPDSWFPAATVCS